MNEPEVYPVGTITRIFSGSGEPALIIPNKTPVPLAGGKPPEPKLSGNSINIPPYKSTAVGTIGPTPNRELVASYPAAADMVVPVSKVKSVKLKLPEPDHTTPPPTCETVTLKSPATADVGVGVGVTEVSVGVSVTNGVPVGVNVLVGVTVGVGVTPNVAVGVGVISEYELQ
jgi:hypothetical protein